VPPKPKHVRTLLQFTSPSDADALCGILVPRLQHDDWCVFCSVVSWRGAFFLLLRVSTSALRVVVPLFPHKQKAHAATTICAGRW
jgi:hypothetical protein